MSDPLVPQIFTRRVNDDVGARESLQDQFFPAISVDATGTLWMMWYDRRDVSSGTFKFHTYYAKSADQGLTWSSNQRMTLGATDGRNAPFRGFINTRERFLGDYNGSRRGR